MGKSWLVKLPLGNNYTIIGTSAALRQPNLSSYAVLTECSML